MHYSTILVGFVISMSITAVSLTHATDIIPAESQTKLLRGVASHHHGIRYVEAAQDNQADDKHGPITYYSVPFHEGTFSLKWKVEIEQTVVFVFDSKNNGKATHVLKVFVNGGVGKGNHSKSLTLVTYDGSTTQKKKAKITKHDYHVDAGQWHTASVAFNGNKANVTINDQTFTTTSERLREPIEKCGVMHHKGILKTQTVKITQ